MEDQRTRFALQNFHGHAKEFLRKLKTVWASALQEIRQPCDRPSKRVLVEIQLVPNLASGIQK
jgi:hypothetical protein